MKMQQIHIELLKKHSKKKTKAWNTRVWSFSPLDGLILYSKCRLTEGRVGAVTSTWLRTRGLRDLRSRGSFPDSTSIHLTLHSSQRGAQTTIYQPVFLIMENGPAYRAEWPSKIVPWIFHETGARQCIRITTGRLETSLQYRHLPPTWRTESGVTSVWGTE